MIALNCTCLFRASLASLIVLHLALMAEAAPPGTVPVEGLRENPASLHAIVNATVITRPGHQIEKATVVFSEGSLIAVGSEIAPPSGAIIHDLAGKRIYPGLMDSYTETQVVAASGVTRHWNGQVTPEFSVADSYQPDDSTNSKLRLQGVVCRLVAPNAGIIKGSSCIVSTAGDSGPQAVWKSCVAQHLRLGISRNRSVRGFPSSPMGAVALARQTFLDADWYTKAWMAFRSNPALPQPERNSALEGLGASLQRGDRFIIDSVNELYLLRADDFAREFSLNAIMRGSGQEYQRLSAVQATGRSLILPVDFPSPPKVDSPEAIQSADLAELLHWDFAPENPARLNAAGVSFSFCSAGLEDVGAFLSNVRKAVERGLPKDVALAALTTTPASLLGIEGRFGTLEAGKSASFFVTEGELFDKDTRILETWIDGKRYPNKGTDELDIRGKWIVRIALPGGDSQEYTVSIQGKSDRLKAEMELPEGSQEAVEDASEQSGGDAQSAATDPNVAAEADESKGEDQPSAASPIESPNTQSTPESSSEKSVAESSKEDRKNILESSKLSLADRKLTGSLPGKKLGQEGAIQFSATMIEVPGQPLRASGRVTLANGETLLLSATREDVETETKEKEKLTETASSQESSVPQQAVVSVKPSDVDDSGGDPKLSASPDAGKKSESSELSVMFPLGAHGRLAAPEQPENLVIKNVTIWTCGEAGIVEGGTVVVHAGKIVNVGVDLPVPEGATVVDGTGKHVTPGLIDCHSHTATDGGINESTQAITAEVRIADFINCDDIDIYRQLAGGITTANVLHGSANPIGGQNQVIKLRWSELYDQMRFREAPAGIKFALGENVKRSNRPEGFGERYPASRMGVEQIIRDAFQAARDYQKQWEAWHRDHDSLPPRKDLELEALSEVLRGQRWVHCHSYRQDEILALLRTCEDYGIQIATLQHILEGYKVADAIARHGAMGSSFSDWWAYKVEVYDAIPYNGALMHQAGVVVSFNSDDRELARHMNHEAAKAIRYGDIPPEEALKFVTLNPARQLRIEQYVGSIEVGKHADFVVWSGPPLSLLSRCEQTWIDGKKYFDIQDDQESQETARSLRNRLVQKVIASGESPKGRSERPRAEETLWPLEDEFCRARNLR